MAFDILGGEQRELRDLVRQLARERIAPRAAEIDASHEFPWDVVELFRENDIFGLFFEEQYGGLGTGALLSLITIEEVGKVCATSALILAVQELGSLGLKLAGSGEQKERYLPKFASGEWLPAYAPDLNPVEAMWSCTKYSDLANHTPANLRDLGEAATDSLISQYGDHRTKRSYFQTAKLNLWLAHLQCRGQ